jgi:hypothetical protein
VRLVAQEEIATALLLELLGMQPKGLIGDDEDL